MTIKMHGILTGVVVFFRWIKN